LCAKGEELKMLKLDDVSLEDGTSCPEKFVEEIKCQSERKQQAASADCPSTENSDCTAGCRTSDDVSAAKAAEPIGMPFGEQAAAAMSDSELICQKQRKLCVLDDADNVEEDATPTGEAAGPASAGSFLRAVQSFPLPPDQRNRPVVGPPSLDDDALRRMERLVQLGMPESLPQEDVDRVARLEQLKQLSCRQ